MIAALVLSVASPIVLRVIVPDSVRPGEKVEIVVEVKNASNAPVTLVKAELPSLRLGMRLARTVSGPSGKTDVDYSSAMMGQWFTRPEVGTDAFFTLRPSESRELYRESFVREFVGGRPASGLIVDYAKAARRDLSPGRYRWQASYALHRIVPARANPPFKRGSMYMERELTFTSEARKLLARTWQGEVSAEATFDVTP